MIRRSPCAAMLIFFSIPFLSIIVRGETLELNDDVLGLIVFKSGLQDPSGSLDSWNEDDPSPCSWRFVTCHPGNNRVWALSLDNLRLSGKIGCKGLVRLDSLTSLTLSHNNLTGPVNPDLALVRTLRTLDLSHNSLSGVIPSGLSNLQYLDLSHNSLSGVLSENTFDNLSFSLRHIDLSGNELEGPVPTRLSKCASLNHLNLSGNRFSGEMKFDWSTKTRLRTLDLSNNELTGQLPGGISAVHNLKELVLNGNRFSGTLPEDIGLCPHLNRIDISNNLFIGNIPESFRRLNSLVSLRLSDNFFAGSFPTWIGKLNALERLDMSKNGFDGRIPEGLFDSRLEEIDLSRNNLSGLIPHKLSATIRVLNLSWNHLESKIPPELGYLRNLSVLDLRSNGFIGSIPAEICDSGSLVILQLDGNSLTGPIPDRIGKCSSLNLLSLSHNNLTGPIPESISSLTKLEILKLEVNRLSGEIPRELGGLESLLVANVSHNRLVGRLPDGGIFSTIDSSAIDGNLGICSPVLKGPCVMNVPKPLVLDPYAYGNDHRGKEEGSAQRFRHHRFLSVSVIVSISAAAVIAVGVLVISLLSASARRRLAFVEGGLESMCSSSSTKSSSLTSGKLVLFDSKSSSHDWSRFDSVLDKAEEVGEGVFGSVYRASFGNQGPTLAIKKLITTNTLQYQEEFDREVRVLGKARHSNLVPLRGYYWTPHLQLLVSDFAKNGSLQSRLHEPSSAPLTWAERFRIVIGTAKGLAHLHHSFRPPIIHYNLKPSNVLLDENMNPRISDFGLARLLTKLDRHVVSSRFQSAAGYVAPELACQSLRVNEKCDVHGFGVLILEVVTGRRPVEYGEDNVVILSDHVRVLLEQGDVLDCVDRRMGEYLEEELLPVLKLALVCTSQIPSSRPSMAEVVQILQVINTPVPNRTMVF